MCMVHTLLYLYLWLYCRDQEKDKVRIDSEEVAAILARVSLGIAFVYIDNASCRLIIHTCNRHESL